MATSINLAYSGFFEAAKMSDGLVVASCGLYFPIVAKSPESQTTVVPVALSCSREDVMFAEVFIKCRRCSCILIMGCNLVFVVKRFVEGR